jgi:hypothetical protein
MLLLHAIPERARPRAKQVLLGPRPALSECRACACFSVSLLVYLTRVHMCGPDNQNPTEIPEVLLHDTATSMSQSQACHTWPEEAGSFLLRPV